MKGKENYDHVGSCVLRLYRRSAITWIGYELRFVDRLVALCASANERLEHQSVLLMTALARG